MEKERGQLPDERQEAVLSADINSIIKTADSLIRKQYLSELEKGTVAPVKADLACIQPGKNIRLFKITSLSYGRNENIYEKITNLYSAVTEFHSSQVMILDSSGDRIDLYLGIACNETDRLSTQFDTFKSSFIGNFPGGKISVLNAEKNEELLNSFFDEPGIRISSVSALSSPDQGKQDQIYRIEDFIDGMYGKPFTMILISETVDKKEIRNLRQSLEAAYTQLTPLRDYTLSISANSSQNYTQSFNLTKSESVTEGKTVTENTSFGHSRNQSRTVPTDQEEQKEKDAKNQIMGTVLSLTAMLAGLGDTGGNVLQGLFYGGAISNIFGSAQTLLNGAELTETQTEGENDSYSLSFSESETKSWQKGFSSSKGIADARASGNGRSLQMRYENRSIHDLLSILEKQILRLRHIEETGGFENAAYFITGDNSTALTVGNMYRSFLGRGNAMGQENAINIWDDKRQIEGISDYLRRMNHPKFYFSDMPDYGEFRGCSLIAADEMPAYMSLPGKSICGLPVSVHAEFARDIIDIGNDGSDKLDIGNIFHLGRVQTQKVFISKNGLRGHMFVSGSTGMGKSNFCYGLLDSLHKKNVKFMVIEPAKGEYHKVFGGCEDVHSFGTNPNLMPVLKINPFSFPEGIHVNEHIDRLLEIFNSCWPMYAAMPAILKEGLETVYKEKGYNLITGKAEKREFPTFADLLKALPGIINNSMFSGEVKGNYAGALLTRVKSLTDGLYGYIFSEDEIGDEKLFDENVLIDLSRTGSGETKALIMGILVMRLQEYRMSKGKMNASLSHVTILEEAHHLLKKASSSSAEGVNLREMSLEMITNAIAEMRTYGEGFVIADQSPSLLDPSVIRNTNTKVIFKLPENSDRAAAGNAMSLSEEQIRELARLECGVAAVYQSNWDNGALVKIKYFDEKDFKPFTYTPAAADFDKRQLYSQCVALILRERLKDNAESSVNPEICSRLMDTAVYASGGLGDQIGLIQEYIRRGEKKMSFADVCRHIDRIVDTKTFVERCGERDDIEKWEEKARAYLGEILSLNDGEVRELILLCLNIRAGDSPEMKKFYFRYFGYGGVNGKCSLKG